MTIRRLRFYLDLKRTPSFGDSMRTFSDRAMSIQPTGVRKMFDLAGDDVDRKSVV